MINVLLVHIWLWGKRDCFAGHQLWSEHIVLMAKKYQCHMKISQIENNISQQFINIAVGFDSKLMIYSVKTLLFN